MIYTCTVIYGWYEGDLRLWDEVDIEVVYDIERMPKFADDETIRSIVKERAIDQFTATVAQAMGGYAFAFVETIQEGNGTDWEDPDKETE
jgi:hypothetical protein